jgi:nitronate monooxygenase
MTFPDRRIQSFFSVEFPIIQAPMAGSVGSEMVVAVSEAGGLGSLPCAMLTPEQARIELGIIRQRTARPINVNFFCHQPPEHNSAVEATWKERFRPYYAEFALDPDTATVAGARMPFDSAMADVVAEFTPEVVSFHFGLPEPSLVERVRATGAKLLSSATSVDEARWLEDHGCDAIIAQGYEAGGHRGMFLS